MNRTIFRNGAIHTNCFTFVGKTAALLFSMLTLFLTGFAQLADSSQREVKLQGAVNFRDLGGYTTSDGRHVRWDRIYRSADISKLTDADLDTLKNRHISSVVDLRGVDESKKAPDRLNPGTEYILCPAGSDNNLNDWMKSIAGLKSGGDSMMKVYYANTTFLADRYRPFFERLLDLRDDQALVFHCTAGKDRTGIGAALLLYVLGVPFATIEKDYAATDYYWRTANEKMVGVMVRSMHVNEQVARDMGAARREYILTTFDRIRSQYGSVDKFLKGSVGLDDAKIAALKRKFLD
ncbi:MAG: tyrosine-protein phosphatase [Puia sp.]|nr:tyrosine-protein phosphatase [Puia sp.]